MCVCVCCVCCVCALVCVVCVQFEQRTLISVRLASGFVKLQLLLESNLQSGLQAKQGQQWGPMRARARGKTLRERDESKRRKTATELCPNLACNLVLEEALRVHVDLLVQLVQPFDLPLGCVLVTPGEVRDLPGTWHSC